VTAGRNDEECRNNAKLAISIARKMGSLIFVVPEDLIERRGKLVFTFLATLWSHSQAHP